MNEKEGRVGLVFPRVSSPALDAFAVPPPSAPPHAVAGREILLDVRVPARSLPCSKSQHDPSSNASRTAT